MPMSNLFSQQYPIVVVNLVIAVYANYAKTVTTE